MLRSGSMTLVHTRTARPGGLKLSSPVASNKDLEARVSSYTSSQSSSVSDLDHLRNRVDETEREKRDLIDVVSRLKEDASQRDEEVQNLRASLRQIHQDHQILKTQVRELRSAETSTKFKLETLSQQLTLAQSETERASSELTAKADKYANYRRTKHAKFIQLQAAQSAQTASMQHLTQALTKAQDLQGQLAEQEAAFTTEVSGLKRLVTIMEEREKQAKDIVESAEHEWASIGDRAEQRERHAREEAEKRLGAAGGHHGEDALCSVPATPGRPSGSASDMMLGLSFIVATVSRVRKGGKTFAEMYADYVRLEEEYMKKCAEYDRMDRTLSDVLAQIEERAPALAQQREDYERLREESGQLAGQRFNSLPLSPNAMPVLPLFKKHRRSSRNHAKRPTFSSINSPIWADRFKRFSRNLDDAVIL
ncbi:hypothetical protein JVU11DRAFT_2179 [Chiua virens]|nr:hypothetical protein JVU11DRAFT_12726 [Chiua virens]KAG9317946.1 hypothetical protein JVU11DRAFT_2179 [Chiua virens]